MNVWTGDSSASVCMATFPSFKTVPPYSRGVRLAACVGSQRWSEFKNPDSHAIDVIQVAAELPVRILLPQLMPGAADTGTPLIVNVVKRTYCRLTAHIVEVSHHRVVRVVPINQAEVEPRRLHLSRPRLAELAADAGQHVCLDREGVVNVNADTAHVGMKTLQIGRHNHGGPTCARAYFDDAGDVAVAEVDEQIRQLARTLVEATGRQHHERCVGAVDVAVIECQAGTPNYCRECIGAFQLIGGQLAQLRNRCTQARF